MILWTAYTAPITAPAVESITEDGRELSLPEGYEAAADRIEIDEIGSNIVTTFVTLAAREPGFVLDRLASKLDRIRPIRLVLAGYPEDGVCHTIHLPTTTVEGASTHNLLMVSSTRDFDNDIPMRRDFWFGENFDAKSMGFLPIEETS